KTLFRQRTLNLVNAVRRWRRLALHAVALTARGFFRFCFRSAFSGSRMRLRPLRACCALSPPPFVPPPLPPPPLPLCAPFARPPAAGTTKMPSLLRLCTNLFIPDESACLIVWYPPAQLPAGTWSSHGRRCAGAL